MQKSLLSLATVSLVCFSVLSASAAEETEVVRASTLPPSYTVKKVTVIKFDKQESKPITGGVLRRFINGQNGTLAVFDLSKGGTVPRHHHKYEQVSYIVRGAVKVTIWDKNGTAKEHLVRGGELIVLPPYIEHQFEALEDGTVDIDFFSPSRDDWKKGQEKYFGGSVSSPTKPTQK